MAQAFTLYRFQIEISDVDRGVYESVEFRTAQHPSEGIPYLLTRVIAYVLNYQEGLEFAPTGLHDPEASAIHIKNSHGDYDLVIEIASPSAKKLHKATKHSKAVKVYTYKNPALLMNELRLEKVHKIEEIEFFSIQPQFLEDISVHLKRDNKWGILLNDGTLTVQIGDQSVNCEIKKFHI